MNTFYYTATLKDGTVLDFNKKCVRVDFSNANYIVFTDDCKTLLGIIPRESVAYIDYPKDAIVKIEKE